MGASFWAQMKKRNYKLIQTAIITAALLFYFGIKALPPAKHTAAEKSGQFYLVTRVIDGDTIKLSDGTKVRLIGVDTPELHYSDKLVRDARRTGSDIKTIQELGRKACTFTKKLLDKHEIRIDNDVVGHDKYGRTLAYVFLKDGTFVNAKILEEGYGQVMTIPPNVKYADYFLKLERKARDDNSGLWADGAYRKLRK